MFIKKDTVMSEDHTPTLTDIVLYVKAVVLFSPSSEIYGGFGRLWIRSAV